MWPQGRRGTTAGTVRLRFKVPSLRSESLGNALAAKVQSLAQAGGGKVFPRPILASSSSEPRPSLVGAKVRASSEPGHPKVPRESRQPHRRHLKPLTQCRVRIPRQRRLLGTALLQQRLGMGDGTSSCGSQKMGHTDHKKSTTPEHKGAGGSEHKESRRAEGGQTTRKAQGRGGRGVDSRGAHPH